MMLNKNSKLVTSVYRLSKLKSVRIFSAVLLLFVLCYGFVLLCDVHEVKNAQLQAIGKVKSFIDKFRLAYRGKESRFFYGNKYYRVIDGEVFRTDTFIGSDLKTRCKFKLKIKINENHRADFFLMVVPRRRACFDQYSKNGSLSSFRARVIDY